MRYTLLLAAVLLTMGCRSMDTTDLPEGLTICPETRPQVCTREYQPVCAWLPATGEWKTYSNGCVACSDQAVAGYREGGCEGDTGKQLKMK